jgi:hypothetical protein
MTNVSGHIIKSENIKVEGQFRLEIGPSALNSVRQKNNTHNTTQAKIVETNPEFAVLEITCSCGTKTHVRCEYNNEQAAN